MLTHQNTGEKKNNQLQWEERLPHVHTEIWWDFSLSTFLVFLSKAFLLHKLYHIMLFSSRVPERSHRVTSALFLMVRHLNETTIVLICFFRNFLFFVAHSCIFYFLLPIGMGSLWQAIRGKQSSPAWQSQLPEGRDFWGRYWRSRILNIEETWKKYWWRWSGLLRAILEEKINLKTNR